MKNVAKHLGLIGVILFITSILFKHFHLAGAGVILTLACLLGLIYYISSLFCKDIHALGGFEQAKGISLAVNMIVFFVSFLFKMMHWPGANILLGVSVLFFIVFILIALISMYAKKQNNSSQLSNLYLISILYMAAVLIMFGLRSLS
jgi:hypothetical protein